MIGGPKDRPLAYSELDSEYGMTTLTSGGVPTTSLYRLGKSFYRMSDFYNTQRDMMCNRGREPRSYSTAVTHYKEFVVNGRHIATWSTSENSCLYIAIDGRTHRVPWPSTQGGVLQSYINVRNIVHIKENVYFFAYSWNNAQNLISYQRLSIYPLRINDSYNQQYGSYSDAYNAFSSQYDGSSYGVIFGGLEYGYRTLVFQNGRLLAGEGAYYNVYGDPRFIYPNGSTSLSNKGDIYSGVWNLITSDTNRAYVAVTYVQENETYYLAGLMLHAGIFKIALFKFKRNSTTYDTVTLINSLDTAVGYEQMVDICATKKFVFVKTTMGRFLVYDAATCNLLHDYGSTTSIMSFGESSTYANINGETGRYMVADQYYDNRFFVKDGAYGIGAYTVNDNGTSCSYEAIYTSPTGHAITDGCGLFTSQYGTARDTHSFTFYNRDHMNSVVWDGSFGYAFASPNGKFSLSAALDMIFNAGVKMGVNNFWNNSFQDYGYCDVLSATIAEKEYTPFAKPSRKVCWISNSGRGFLHDRRNNRLLMVFNGTLYSNVLPNMPTKDYFVRNDEGNYLGGSSSAYYANGSTEVPVFYEFKPGSSEAVPIPNSFLLGSTIGSGYRYEVDAIIGDYALYRVCFNVEYAWLVDTYKINLNSKERTLLSGGRRHDLYESTQSIVTRPPTTGTSAVMYSQNLRYQAGVAGFSSVTTSGNTRLYVCSMGFNGALEYVVSDPLFSGDIYVNEVDSNGNWVVFSDYANSDWNCYCAPIIIGPDGKKRFGNHDLVATSKATNLFVGVLSAYPGKNNDPFKIITATNAQYSGTAQGVYSFPKTNFNTPMK